MKLRSARRGSSPWVLAIGLVIQAAATAQTTATIVGTVTDESGAVVPNSAIKVTNELTGWTRDFTSGTDGEYLANLLPPGIYSVEVSAQGFKRVIRKGISLTVGQNATVDIALALGTVTETISIIAAAALVDTRNASIATVMDTTRILELPLNGRTPASLLALLPGVTTVI